MGHPTPPICSGISVTDISPATAPSPSTRDPASISNDSGLTRHTSAGSPSEKSDDTTYIVDFSPDHPKNPINFSRRKKWALTALVSFFTMMASISATSFGMGTPSMIPDLNATESQATLGLSLYCLGFGIMPLFTSAFSEEFGRLPMYYFTISGFILVHLVIPLLPTISLVVSARFVQGAFGSTAATIVAGTIADIWAKNERGIPLCFWSSFGFAANGLGAVMGGWIELNPRLGWKWIQWIQLIIGGVYFVVFLLVVEETRPFVILQGMARQRRKQTGDERYLPYAAGKKQATLRERVYISFTRPIYFLFTEPIVLACSVWVGFAWGVYFGMIQSIPDIFRALHGFDAGQIGTVYSAMIVGGTISFFTNFYQEKLYRRNVARRGNEARLYTAIPAAILFPISMYIFAWSSTPSVPWVVLYLALVIYIWSVSTVFLTIFAYLAEGYGTYASSALSGQSLFRNILATVFPLFSDQMFSPTRGLGYRWANTVLATAALLMAPIPIILFMYGPRIWARSKFRDSRS